VQQLIWKASTILEKTREWCKFHLLCAEFS
jgi:hypothetical protein